MATKPVFDDVAPWPDTTKHSTPGIGHNNPPLAEIVPRTFRDTLLAEHPDFMQRLDDSIQAASRATVENDEQLGNAGDLINIYRALDKHICATHKDVKAPYLEGGKLVDAEKNALIARITPARTQVQTLMDRYAAAKLEAEREARKEEAEQRAKLEAIARENNIDPALIAASEDEKPKGPVRSDAGAAVTVTTEWACEVEDYVKAFRTVKDDAKVRAAIDAAVKSIVKATKGAQVIPGVRIYERAKTGAR